MNADLQQYWPVIAVIGGVIGVGIFVKKTGWIGVIVVAALAVVWVLRSNPQWFAKLDGSMERLVEVQKAD